MMPSRIARLIAVFAATAWIAAPSLSAQDAGQARPPAQIDSPLLTPGASPLATPILDPANCSETAPCSDAEPTPLPPAQVFLPGVAQSGSAENEPPGPPPDLGTILNYVAVVVIIVGGALKIYWVISDRRNRADVER